MFQRSRFFATSIFVLMIALASCGQPAVTTAPQPTVIPESKVVIHMTTTSDWTDFRLVSGGTWSNSKVTSSSPEATSATIEGDLVSLSQPLTRAEAGKEVELTLEVLFRGLDPSSQLVFEIQRGFIGWTRVEISTMWMGNLRC